VLRQGVTRASKHVDGNGMLNEGENFGDNIIALFLLLMYKELFIYGQQNLNYDYLKLFVCLFSWLCGPIAGHGLLVHEVSLSHTTTRHSR
jgi:hypothetical protein